MEVVDIFHRVAPGGSLGCDSYLVVDLGIVHVLLGDVDDCRTGEDMAFQRAEVIIA